MNTGATGLRHGDAAEIGRLTGRTTHHVLEVAKGRRVASPELAKVIRKYQRRNARQRGPNGKAD